MKHIGYVWNITKFAFKANPLLYVSIGISLFSIVIELLAMSSLFPLFELVSGKALATDSMIARSMMLVGLAVNAWALLWVFLVLFAIRIVTQLAGQSLSIYLGRRVMAQLSSRSFEQITQNISISEINKKSIGYYISLSGDESFRASTLVISLTQFVSTAVLALLYFSAIANYSPVTAGLVVVFFLFLMLPMFYVLKISHRLGGKQTSGSRLAHSVFLDSLNNLKAVRSFSAENYVAGIYKSIIFGYTKILFLIDALSLLTRLLPILVLMLFFGIWLILGDRPLENIGLSFIVTMIVYLMRFFPTVGQGVNLLMKIASDAKSGKDVTAILDVKKVALESNGRSISNIDVISLQEVCFSYDENSKKNILRGINLKFEKGNSYALMGKSGVGKSTLIDLLLKFYLPTSGYLYINGHAISEITESAIRKKIMLVSQEAAIFDDTVMNNICMGWEASLVEVQAACTAACIHDVIEKMEDGYNTRLQYQGKNLSGGQRQRIAIARALLRKPEVLIFDESTSALDKATQEHVVDNILRDFSEKIVIFVSHDPHLINKVSSVIDLTEVNHL